MSLSVNDVIVKKNPQIFINTKNKQNKVTTTFSPNLTDLIISEAIGQLM